MKNLILILITSCSTYQGIVVSNHDFSQTSRVRVDDNHYVVVSGYYPTYDTLIILKSNLRVINK